MASRETCDCCKETYDAIDGTRKLIRELTGQLNNMEISLGHFISQLKCDGNKLPNDGVNFPSFSKNDGNCPCLIDLIALHNFYGTIRKEDVSQSKQSLDGHIKLIQSAKRRVEDKNVRETDEVDEYLKRVFKYISVGHQSEALLRNKSIEDKFNLVLLAFESLKEEIETYEKYSYEYVGDLCPICKFLKVPPDTYKHVVSTGLDKDKRVLITSCPYLLNLSTYTKSDFLRSIQFCTICGMKPVKDHDECNTYTDAKCLDENCLKHFALCSTHTKRNSKKHKRTKNILKFLKVENYKF